MSTHAPLKTVGRQTVEMVGVMGLEQEKSYLWSNNDGDNQDTKPQFGCDLSYKYDKIMINKF